MTDEQMDKISYMFEHYYDGSPISSELSLDELEKQIKEEEEKLKKYKTWDDFFEALAEKEEMTK